MNRRSVIAGTFAVFWTRRAAKAQQAPRIPRIGYLVPGPATCPPTIPTSAFRQGLADAGYIEGRDLTLDRRCFSRADLAEKVLEDLLKATLAVLVVAGNRAATAARDRALGIPVVFVEVPDPVGSRMIQTLARPGTNMTGLADLTLDLNAKRLQLLKEAFPGVRRISTLGMSEKDNPGTERARADIEQAAATLGLHLRHFTVRTIVDVPGVFEAMKKDDVQAFVVVQAPVFWAERVHLADLATKYRLPAMYPHRAYVDGGGLISYGADQAELWRRAAGYVTKILAGAKPRDLPVEQPATFDLSVNLKTAKALGLTIPPALVLQANHLVQ